MIVEGIFFDYNGWKVWLYGGHKMSTKEKVEEAKEIVKSGYLKFDHRMANILKNRKTNVK